MELLTIKEVSKMLKMSESSIRKLIFYKKIPFIKLGYKTIRFCSVEIEKWIREKSVNGDNNNSNKKKKTKIIQFSNNPFIDNLVKDIKQDFLKKFFYFFSNLTLTPSINHNLNHALLGGVPYFFKKRRN